MYEGHGIDVDRIARDVHLLLACFLASAEMRARSTGLASDPIGFFWGYTDDEITHAIIRIATYLRIHPDAWGSTPCDSAESPSCGRLERDGKVEDLGLREACNKIIHATRVALDFDEAAEPGRREPRIELEGRSQGGRPWRAIIDVLAFAKAIKWAIG